MECVLGPHAEWRGVYALCKRIFSLCPVAKASGEGIFSLAK